MTKNKEKLDILMIGIDGADWRTINPLLKKGELPNLKKLMEKSAYGPLKSIKPMLTPLVWTSIATGKKPSKHGVTNLFSTVKDLNSKRFWNILAEEKGYTSGIFYYPVTWPPEKIENFMIPSFLARDSSTHPESLSFIKEIEEIGRKQKDKTGNGFDYKNGLINLIKLLRSGVSKKSIMNIGSFMLKNVFGRLKELDRIFELNKLRLKTHEELFIHLIKKYEPNIGVVYFNETDVMAHKFWKYYEPEKFDDVCEEEVSKYENIIPDIYKMVDESIGNLLELADDKTNIIILSDHGSKAMEKEIVNFDVNLKRIFTHIGLPFEMDYSRLGRFTHIDCGDLSENEILELVKNIGNIKVGEERIKLFKIEDFVDEQLVILLSDVKLLSKLERSFLYFGDKKIYRFSEVIKKQKQHTNSGTHAMNGIVLFSSPQVENNIIKNASVLDITPTLLYLNNLPIRKDMDGKILKNIKSDVSEDIKSIYSFDRRTESDILNHVIRDSLEE